VFISSDRMSESEFAVQTIEFMFWCAGHGISATQFGRGYDYSSGHTALFEIRAEHDSEIPEHILSWMTLRWS
jgi:hypothetical protein